MFGRAATKRGGGGERIRLEEVCHFKGLYQRTERKLLSCVHGLDET